MSEHRDSADDPAIDAEMLDVLLMTTAPVEPPPGLRSKVMERIRYDGDHFTTVQLAQGWQELIPGIEFKRLCVDEQAGTKSFLLRARAGMSLPEHTHQGYEECLVLEGEFSMGDLTLRAGDYHAAAAGTTHPPSSTRTGVTVYLRSAIADYPGI